MGAGGPPSGSRSRRGGVAGPARWRRLPVPARTPPPAGGARRTSAACRPVAPGVGALDHPATAGLYGCWQPAGGDLSVHPALGQHLPAGLPVVAGIQMHGGPLRQRADHDQGVQGGGQQPVVTAVGPSRHHTHRDAACLGHRGTLQPLFPTVHRAGPGDLAAAGCLGDAAVHGQVRQLQAEQPVIGAKHRTAQLLGHPEGDPLVPAAAQGGSRAGVIGDAAVAAQPNTSTWTSLSKTTRSGMRGRWQPSGWCTWRAGSSAETWTHRGSRMDDGSAGTSPPCDAGVRAR
jgi:hypothetical protein